MLLIKAATTLLTYLTVSHRINYDACLELYGLRTRSANRRVLEVDGVQMRLPQEPVLAYNRPWLRRVEHAEDVHQAGDEKFRLASTIATARDVVESANSSGTGAWVRHWHEGSGRAYLVHSLTGEAVWEIVSGSKKTPRTMSSARETQSNTAPTLSLLAFENRWDELVDGGGFNCRVSRIPDTHVLAQHLRSHNFRVASDGLRRNDADQQRTVLFYAEDSEDSDDHEPSEPMFMGEFVFDSLSLKLCARFRCGEPEQMVSFVKRLQLKEIVGAYTPCE
ncbi:hypothetical protein BBO99_00003088 [Phytophthora kernoviae]|uniref:Uncharacterized protein n=1 Tax=Phytophthora kernoviae TaxID=325452 RepID=A0A3R7HA30_9STRA|nr:hypothetical protein BBI17_004760 [Phytophthora kernoviae]RLN82201.1 hypothetical protein BBO99_00003088 [Phytophthora kernoviae]